MASLESIKCFRHGVRYCTFCDKSETKSKSSKKVQESSKYNCDSCEKSFNTSGGLKRHVTRIHKGTKPNKCQSCGKIFSTSRSLLIHNDINHKEKNSPVDVNLGSESEDLNRISHGLIKIANKKDAKSIISAKHDENNSVDVNDVNLGSESEDEEITFKVDTRGNYDAGMKALEILDELEKEAENEENIDENSFVFLNVLQIHKFSS